MPEKSGIELLLLRILLKRIRSGIRILLPGQRIQMVLRLLNIMSRKTQIFVLLHRKKRMLTDVPKMNLFQSMFCGIADGVHMNNFVNNMICRLTLLDVKDRTDNVQCGAQNLESVSRCPNCGNNLIGNKCKWCGRVYTVKVKMGIISVIQN